MNNKHFSRKEFACKCGCGFNVVDVDLLELLTYVRCYFDKPVIITSGCRCEAYNEKIGGTKNSKHKLGLAADIVVKDINPNDVYNFLCLLSGERNGIGKYDNFTHIDIRKEKARF